MGLQHAARHIQVRTPGFFFLQILSMSSHRIGARLSGLSPEQLCAFIDEQAPLWSAAAMHVAEEHAARLVEQPEWSSLSEQPHGSPDLVPHILAQLPTKDHAAKGTCRAWRRGWKETLEKRERPRLLVFGGHDSNDDFVNSMERYDPSTNEWEEETVAPMLTTRANVGMAVLDGKLYAVGGESEADGQDEEDDGATSNLVERYDLATKSCEAVAPMATARRSSSAAVLGGKLYAMGGVAAWNDIGEDGRDHLSSVERYDPALDAWEAVASMAMARQQFGAAVLDGKIYVVGGLCDGLSLSSIERYDPATNAWQAVAPMGTARQGPAVAVLDGKLYVAGGYNDDDDPSNSLSSVERFDPALHAWEAVAPMATARQQFGAAVLDGAIYVVAGCNNDHVDPLSSVERYDPAVNEWEEVAPVATGRDRLGAAVL